MSGEPLPTSLIVDLYEQGRSYNEIAKMLGVCVPSIQKIVKKFSTPRTTSEAMRLYNSIHGDCQVPTDWSFRPLTPGTAWLVGLIFGDGNLSKKNASFDVTNGDVDILNKINSLFDNRLKIRWDKRTECCGIITANSARLVQELKEDFGLLPNKSRTIEFPNIDDWLLPHFIRGLLDSDGCFFYRKECRKEYLSFSYGSMSENFVRCLKEVLVSQVRIPDNSKVTKHGTWKISYCGKSAVVIGNYLYDYSVPEMRGDRKYKIFLDYLASGHGQKTLARLRNGQ